MLLTEEEAGEKVCPILSVKQEGIGLMNTNTCIGSSCMIWRWGGETYNEKGRMIPTGYCGLARKS